VRLESIVFRHQQGDTPEQIHESFPSVPLPDIYATVAYYLRHKEEVDAYVSESEADADRFEARLEAEYPTRDLRDKLRKLRAGGSYPSTSATGIVSPGSRSSPSS
jgi:hypothetical protein